MSIIFETVSTLSLDALFNTSCNSIVWFKVLIASIKQCIAILHIIIFQCEVL